MTLREQVEQIPSYGFDATGMNELIPRADVLVLLRNVTTDPVTLGDLKAEVAWRNAALRVGEELAPNGPDGYYGFSATEWRQWAMFVLRVPQPYVTGVTGVTSESAAKRILELELENATLAAAVEAKEQDCVLLDAKLLECTKDYEAAERGLAEWQEKAKGLKRCGAKHFAPDAECELPAGHTENHRGACQHGSVQWPSGGGI